MNENIFEICDRCGDKFDIDKAYKVLKLIDHPHREDVELGNIGDNQRYTICGDCSVKFRVWLEPEVDSVEELLPSGAKRFLDTEEE